jgi:hypothetical protein
MCAHTSVHPPTHSRSPREHVHDHLSVCPPYNTGGTSSREPCYSASSKGTLVVASPSICHVSICLPPSLRMHSPDCPHRLPRQCAPPIGQCLSVYLHVRSCTSLTAPSHYPPVCAAGRRRWQLHHGVAELRAEALSACGVVVAVAGRKVQVT